MVTELEESLQRLEDVLTRSGAAIVPILHPGIDEATITRLLDVVGLTPTSDMVTWFGWHNGAGRPGLPSSLIEVVPGGEFHDLSYLCTEYATTRSIAVEIASMPGSTFTAEQRWPASWFPLLRLFGKGFLTLDLAGDDGAVSPVLISWHDADPTQRARCAWPSIAAFVEEINCRFEAGVYTVDENGIVQGPTIDFPN